MKSYVLNWNGSGETSEIFAEDDEAAIDRACALIGDDPVVAEQWDADGENDDGEPCKRILFWSSDEDAENDSGGAAIAKLSTVGSS